jgi:N-methylhydantoinase B
VRESNLDELLARGEMPTEGRLAGEQAVVPSKIGSVTVKESDVFVFTSNGGGGYGDALLRDAGSVCWDVRGSYVSPEAALEVYGVVLDDNGSVDAPATKAERSRIRASRLGKEPTREAGDHILENGIGVGRRDSEWTCRYCDASLGHIDENFRQVAVAAESELVERFLSLDMYVRPRPAGSAQFVLREYFCPECGYCVVSDVALAGSDMVRAPKLVA